MIKKISLWFALILMTGCTGLVQIEDTAAPKRIALVVKMASGEYWATVKMGADAAAREFGVEVDLIGPEEEEDIQGQIDLIEGVLLEPYDALVLSPSDFEALVPVVEMAFSQMPVIIIDADIQTDQIHSFVGTDNYLAGQVAGETLVEWMGATGRVAVISFVKGSGNAEHRENGLMSVLDRYLDIEVVALEYSLSDADRAERLTTEIIEKQGPIDAVIALNTYSSIGAARAIHVLDLKDQVTLVTFDTTPENIILLQDEVIKATVVQNPYAMGYLGVKYALDAINGLSVPDQVDTGAKVIHRGNMYLPENEKLLFPFVQ